MADGTYRDTARKTLTARVSLKLNAHGSRGDPAVRALESTRCEQTLINTSRDLNLVQDLSHAVSLNQHTRLSKRCEKTLYNHESGSEEEPDEAVVTGLSASLKHLRHLALYMESCGGPSGKTSTSKHSEGSTGHSPY